MSRKEFFNNVNFGGRESKSGPGSEGIYAEDKKLVVSETIRRFEIESVVDVGCGDMFWMRHLLPKIKNYYGIDINEELIVTNGAMYRGEYLCMDVANEKQWQKFVRPEKVDLVVCLEVAYHLLQPELEKLLAFIQEKVRPEYLMLLEKPVPELSVADNRWCEKHLSEHETFSYEIAQTYSYNYGTFDLYRKKSIRRIK